MSALASKSTRHAYLYDTAVALLMSPLKDVVPHRSPVFACLQAASGALKSEVDLLRSQLQEMHALFLALQV